ncbi:hypothetical protein J6590_103796 [Homalodisca vitripennis]|nr:hypothetical protein J6590_103796 [Homalodisca vitripennis]
MSLDERERIDDHTRKHAIYLMTTFTRGSQFLEQLVRKGASKHVRCKQEVERKTNVSLQKNILVTKSRSEIGFTKSVLKLL